MTTAATERYLIEAVDGRVDLCESQGGAWVTIERDIDTAGLLRAGFNLDSPAVQRVLTTAANWHGHRAGGGEVGWGIESDD